jgi:D-alanyl-D-alanine dipeptidase
MMLNFSFKVKDLPFKFLLFSLFGFQVSMTQELKVISDAKLYKTMALADSLHRMCSLHQLLPGATIDLRYATKNNFTGQRLYPKGNQTFLRLPAAKALQTVAAEFSALGYELMIWDAYRPYEATKKMWDLIGDERYVANPAKGSGHNRGLAVDLTLTKGGQEVNMGTGFDHFSDTAHHMFKDLPVEVLKNRQLLRSTMEKYGFRALETEWWHYSWPNDRNYDVLNLSFQKLKKQMK